MNEATETVEECIMNEEGLYRLAQTCRNYNEFADLMEGCKTPWGGIAFDSDLLDYDYLDDVIKSTRGEE